MRSKLYIVMAVIMVAVMALSACTPAPTAAPVHQLLLQSPLQSTDCCGTADKPCVITFVPIRRSWQDHPCWSRYC